MASVRTPPASAAPRLRTSDPGAALGCQATLAFLTEPGADSLPLFREALKQHRKATGLRKAALPDEFGVFHLLALIAAGETTLNAEMTGVRDFVAAVRYPADRALGGLVELVAGADELAKEAVNGMIDAPKVNHGQGPLVAALIGLSISIIDGRRANLREVEDRRGIAQWGGQAPLAVRVLCQVHARASRDPASWRSTLDALGPGYPRQLFDIVAIRPPWERALDRLQSFLDPPASPKVDPARKDKRLIFRSTQPRPKSRPWSSRQSVMDGPGVDRCRSNDFISGTPSSTTLHLKT